MKYMLKIMLSFALFYHDAYAENMSYMVDKKIEQSVKSITQESLGDIADVVHEVYTALDRKVSLQELQSLLSSHKLCSFFLLENPQSIEEIKFLLGIKVYMYILEACKYKMLHKLDKIAESLRYWQEELFYEQKPLLYKNVTRWVHNDSYIKQIHENIDGLENLLEKIFYFLGLIQHDQQLLAQNLDMHELEKNFKMVVKVNNIFFDIVATQNDHQNIYTVINSTITEILCFNEDLSTLYGLYRPMHHIYRNWAGYTAGCTTLCVTGMLYYMYQDDIIMLCNQTNTTLYNLWDKHVKDPIYKLQHAILGTGSIPKFSTDVEEKVYRELLKQGDSAQVRGAGVSDVAVLVDESIQIAQQAGEYASHSFWNLIRPQDQLPQNHEHGENDEIYSPEEMQEISLRVAETDGVILSRPQANLRNFVPALERMMYRQIIQVKQQANIVLKELYEDNRLMLGIAALVPLMMVVGLTSLAFQKLYHAKSYEPLKRAIRDLDTFLNSSLGKIVSFQREGQLYFLTEQLKKKSCFLQDADAQCMKQDIIDLQSSSLTYVQKYNVIQRMYRYYTFLFPGTI